MNRPVVIIGADSPALEAASRFIEEDVGSLVVLDDEGRAVGFVTKTDLIERLAREGDLSGLEVSDIMSEPLISVSRSCRLRDAIRVMNEEGINHLPITEEGEPVGIITSTDIKRFF